MTGRFGVALASLVVLAIGPTAIAGASDSSNSGVWSGSTLVPDPRPCDPNDVCGQFKRAPLSDVSPRNVAVAFRWEEVSTTPGCTLPANPTSIPSSPSPVTFSRAVEFECNGTYRSFADASADLNGGSLTLDRTFLVADPAPDVDEPTATAGGARSVVVTWTPLAEPPKDFRGYVVLRGATDGLVTQLASVGPTDSSWTDVEPPAEGGSFTYQVRTRRAGANPADPGDEVTSSGSSSAPIEVARVDDDTGGSDDSDAGGGDDTGGTDGSGSGTGGGSGGSGGSSGGSGGGSTGRGRSPSLSSPSFRVPRVGTPSSNFFPPLLAPPLDTGFDMELPYGEEPGEGKAASSDDLASGLLEGPGRGLMIPFATSLVLAGWAMHLRLLARVARPGYGEPVDNASEIVVY